MASKIGNNSVKRKTVHHLDTPFSITQWPEISPEDQDTILALLCEYISPIGRHRDAHVKPSQGKRRRTRNAHKSALETPSAVAEKPDIWDKVDVGFNVISRTLQGEVPNSANRQDHTGMPYSMVFVSRGEQPSAFNCHYPQMVSVANKTQKGKPDLRLVGFSKSCSEKLGAKLGLPRVSALAIRHGAKNAEPLWQMVKEKVPNVTSAWLDAIGDLEYRSAAIKSMQASVGPKRVKTDKAAAEAT